MYADLLPALEHRILDAAGSIPVVFKGFERQIDTHTDDTAIPSSYSRHDSHELTYLRSGKAEITFENHHRTLLTRGSCIVIRPGMAHSIRVIDGPADFLVLYFGFVTRPAGGLREDANNLADSSASGAAGSAVRSTDIEPRTLEQFISFALGTDMAKEGKPAEPYLLIKGQSRQDIAGVIERILHEDKSNRYGRELMMQLLTMEMIITLARALREEWEESLQVRTGKARELVRIARDYIAENHDRDLTVAEVAGYVFLSQGYFTRAFRDEMGVSPIAYLMQVRVEHACKLLAHKDIKVSGIAAQVGFSSPQRFNAAFRKQTGMTPMEYRRRLFERRG